MQHQWETSYYFLSVYFFTLSFPLPQSPTYRNINMYLSPSYLKSLCFDCIFFTLSSQCTSSHLSVTLPPFISVAYLFFQVNIMVLTRVVVITISTAKRRSIMLAMGTSPVEQTYEQIRYRPQGGAICPLF